MSALGKRVLLTYGGGSIKKLGLYDKVISMLTDYEIFELPGIQPNPKYDPSVLEGVRIWWRKRARLLQSHRGRRML